jgi:ribosomal protein S18 acetylase RimI-like enzyme
MQIRKPRNAEEHRAALAWLVHPAGPNAPDAEPRLAALEAYARKRQLRLDTCLILAEDQHIRAMCLALDSPGRLSMVLMSAGLSAPALRGSAVELMEQVAIEARGRGVQMLQGLIVRELPDEAQLYSACGFRRVANLVYMESRFQPFPRIQPRPSLTWATYGPRTHKLFVDVLERTYEGSLDCEALNGARATEDILASHRATGEFDPALWLIAMSDGQPVGTALGAYIEEHDAFELVYMGCVPQARGHGWGTVLLCELIGRVRQRGGRTMQLSVDEQNWPAFRLYRAFGFVPTTSREVWVRLLTP